MNNTATAAPSGGIMSGIESIFSGALNTYAQVEQAKVTATNEAANSGNGSYTVPQNGTLVNNATQTAANGGILSSLGNYALPLAIGGGLLVLFLLMRK